MFGKGAIVAFIYGFLLLFSPERASSKETETDDDELRLLSYLFKEKYNKEVRPVNNKSHPVEVTIDLAYTQLIDLENIKPRVLKYRPNLRGLCIKTDGFIFSCTTAKPVEKDQVLISNTWLRMFWRNDLLTWDHQKFGGIKSINVAPVKVWVPDIVLYNNADETLASGQMDQFKTKVILSYDGNNSWFSPTILRSRCAIDIEFFPFDDQHCNIKFVSWTYNGLQVDLKNKSDVADTKSYLPSGEFELISATAWRGVDKYSCCPEPYPYIVFTIQMRRKTLFYFNNLIVPCFLITALGLLTFVLPPATGERVTLVITTLLAMTVFMLMIAENTPTTSEVTPLIGKFFIASMVIIGLSLIATCVVLNLYECSRSVDTVPHWLRHILIDILAPFLRVDPPKPRPNIDFSVTKEVETVAVKRDAKTEVLCLPHNKGYGDKNHVSGQAVGWNSNRQGVDIDNNSKQRINCIPEKLAEGISILGERARKQEKVDGLTEEWQVVAKVADRFFLLVFLLTITVTTSYIFLSRPRVDD